MRWAGGVVVVVGGSVRQSGGRAGKSPAAEKGAEVRAQPDRLCSRSSIDIEYIAKKIEYNCDRIYERECRVACAGPIELVHALRVKLKARRPPADAEDEDDA